MWYIWLDVMVRLPSDDNINNHLIYWSDIFMYRRKHRVVVWILPFNKRSQSLSCQFNDMCTIHSNFGVFHAAILMPDANDDDVDGGDGDVGTFQIRSCCCPTYAFTVVIWMCRYRLINYLNLFVNILLQIHAFTSHHISPENIWNI